MVTYFQDKFSKLFPKTFAYLDFTVSVTSPEYLYQPIPDPRTYIEKSNTGDKTIGQVRKRFLGKEEIHLYLENLLNESGYFKQENLNFREIPIVLKILKLIDSQPRFQRFLIHEYEHILQGPKNFSGSKLKKKLEFAEKELNLKYLADYSTLKTMIMAGDFSTGKLNSINKEEMKIFLSRYDLSPPEVEARLKEWIFLKVKNYDGPTMGAFDFTIKKDINKIKLDYTSILEGINKEESKEKPDKKKLFLLKRQSNEYEIFLEYYPKIIKKAEELANIIKEKYLNAIKQQTA